MCFNFDASPQSNDRSVWAADPQVGELAVPAFKIYAFVGQFDEFLLSDCVGPSIISLIGHGCIICYAVWCLWWMILSHNYWYVLWILLCLGGDRKQVSISIAAAGAFLLRNSCTKWMSVYFSFVNCVFIIVHNMGTFSHEWPNAFQHTFHSDYIQIAYKVVGMYQWKRQVHCFTTVNRYCAGKGKLASRNGRLSWI